MCCSHRLSSLLICSSACTLLLSGGVHAQAHELRGMLPPPCDEASELTCMQFLVQTAAARSSRAQPPAQARAPGAQPVSQQLPSGVLVTGLPAALMSCCQVGAPAWQSTLSAGSTAPASSSRAAAARCLGAACCECKRSGGASTTCAAAHLRIQTPAVPCTIMNQHQHVLHACPHARSLTRSMADWFCTKRSLWGGLGQCMHEHSPHLGCNLPCSSGTSAAQAHKLPAELLLDMQVYQPPDAAALGRSAQAFVSFLNHAGACTGADLPASKLVLCAHCRMHVHHEAISSMFMGRRPVALIALLSK